MDVIVYLSNFVIPLVIFYIVAYGLVQKVPVYDTFITGAREGLMTVVKIMPTLIALMIGVGVLRASGFLDFIANVLSAPVQSIGLPAPLVPVTMVKMFSSSAATGLLLDIFKQYGPDSLLGRIASISMSCTETIFYTMSVYFMTAKIKKTRWTLAGALISSAAGVIASILIGNWM